jgi:hypothetical protein
MTDNYEVVAEAQIAFAHSVTIIDVGGDDYRIEIQAPGDGGKTRELRLTVTEAEALMQALMDTVG